MTSLSTALGRDLEPEDRRESGATHVAGALGYEAVWSDGALAAHAGAGAILPGRPRRPTMTEARREPRPEWLRITIRTDESFAGSARWSPSCA